MFSRVAATGARAKGTLSARLAAAGGRGGRMPIIQPAFQTFHVGEEALFDGVRTSTSPPPSPTYKHVSIVLLTSLCFRVCSAGVGLGL